MLTERKVLGMAENSPAFQRWDRDLGVPSPEGTAENHNLSHPFGTQPSIRPHPALKRWAILVRPFGTKTRPRPAPAVQILMTLNIQSVSENPEAAPSIRPSSSSSSSNSLVVES